MSSNRQTGPEKEQTICIVLKAGQYHEYAGQALRSAARATSRKEMADLLEIAKTWLDLAEAVGDRERAIPIFH